MRTFTFIITLIFILPGLSLTAQEESTVEKDTLDYRYREDQFYASITYDLLGNKPSEVSQNGFSNGIHFGIIRDMPINERRNVAIGAGLGFSFNSVNQNLFISKDTQGDFIYNVVDNESFTKNKFTLHLIEVPLEIRWRTSTPSEYNFWRIYTGIKFGYAVISKAKYEGEPSNLKIDILDAIDRFQYGLTLSAGYGALNAHLYFNLNHLFKDSEQLNGQPIDINIIKIGLITYLF